MQRSKPQDLEDIRECIFRYISLRPSPASRSLPSAQRWKQKRILRAARLRRKRKVRTSYNTAYVAHRASFLTFKLRKPALLDPNSSVVEPSGLNFTTSNFT